MRGEKFSGSLILILVTLAFGIIIFNSGMIKAPGSIGDTCAVTSSPTFNVTPSSGTAPLTITSNANAVSWIACVCQAYGQDATETNWGLTFSDGGTGDWTYGPAYQGYVSGGHTYNNAGTYSAGYSLEVICGGDTFTEVISGSRAVTVNASAPADSITATTPSGLSTVTNGTSSTYSSTFTWSGGSSATVIIDHYNANGVSVKNCTTSTTASPKDWSCNDAFVGVGTHTVCAEGSVGTASISPKTICKDVTVEPVISTITISSPSAGNNWTVGTDHTISWTETGSVGNVNIQLSRNGGGTWESVASNLGGTSYLWTVSGSSITTNALIRVVDSVDSNIKGTSGSFTIYKTEPPQTQDPCSLDSASWSTASATEGATVNLRVSTTNCVGEAILFNVEDSDSNPATSNPASKTITADGITTQSWTAEYNPSGTNQYLFVAAINTVGNIQSASPNLVISQPPPGGCDSVVTCEDYSDQASCESDTCTVASASVGSVDCSDPNIDCSCLWDSQSNTCSGTFTSSNPGCGDGIIQSGEQCDGDNWGTTITGCTNFDAFTDGTLSCDPITCLFDTTQCTGGSSGVCGDNVVNAGETCDGDDWGQITSCNDFDEFTGGVLSCDSSCQFNTTECSGGSSQTTSVGRCIYTQQSTGDTCDDGFLSLSWTANWVWDSNNPAHYDPQNLEGQCVDGSKTVECPAQIALPFFGTYNLIAALILVGLVYWVLGLRSRKRK